MPDCSQDTNIKRRDYFCKFLEFGNSDFPQPLNLEFQNIKSAYSQKNYVPSKDVLDATECFIAACAIEKDYPGPSLLLYVSAINIFATGQDETLKNQIKSAKELIKSKNKKLWDNPDIKAMYSAAQAKAKTQSTNKFIQNEIFEALEKISWRDPNLKKLAREIVNSTHETRHQAKIDKTGNRVIITHGKNISFLSGDKMEDSMKFNGGVTGMFQLLHSEYRKLCKPAKNAAAICILKGLNKANNGNGSN